MDISRWTSNENLNPRPFSTSHTLFPIGSKVMSNYIRPLWNLLAPPPQHSHFPIVNTVMKNLGNGTSYVVVQTAAAILYICSAFLHS